ncbi:MAG: hypothetical protein KJO65_03780, partial [Gemmatimonadetes bacterium]|nr:hypothetical protein [Gemmatimonadota bacterium]
VQARHHPFELSLVTVGAGDPWPEADLLANQIHGDLTIEGGATRGGPGRRLVTSHGSRRQEGKEDRPA